MSKTVDQWITYANQHRRCFFFYEQKVLDLTEFILQHPGGKKAMTNYINKDITQILFKVYPHKKEQTLMVLFACTVGTIKDKTSTKKTYETLPMRSETIKSKKKVCFQKKFLCQDENDDKTEESEYTEIRKPSNLKKQPDRPHTTTSCEKRTKKTTEKTSHTSIKTMHSKTFEQDVQYQPVKKQKKKHQKQKQKENLGNYNIVEEQIDEQKPLFLVPILKTKHMNQL